ncbi:MAG: triose-phosphate isomerase [Elusimicrobiota bacterium]
MRKPLIAGNWKMYKTVSEAAAMLNDFKAKVADVKDAEIVICPVYTSLVEAVKVTKGSNVMIGAQDVYWEKEGAFTGQVSPQMIKDVGCTHTLIGHSERRQYFGETNETVNKKVKAALASGLIPIMCVGETLAEREKGNTFNVVESHTAGGLAGLSAEDARKLVIAYEPVWAIGTGKTATPAQAEEVHKFIRGVLEKLYDKNTAESMRILYGGSVKPENIGDLMSQANIDGGLVGGASLKADSFAQIVKFKI